MKPKIFMIWFILTASFSILLFNKDVVFSENTEGIVFTFAPKDGATYTEKLITTTEKQLGPAGTQLDESVITTRIKVKRTEDGWDMISQPVEAVMKRNGQRIDDPIAKILAELTVTYKLDCDGNLLDIEGLEKVTKAVSAKFPPQIVEQLSAILNPDLLKQREASEWNGRIGDYLGKKVTLGEVWEYDVPFTLPNGTNLNYKIKTHFTGMVSCGDSSCIKIEQSYDSNPEGIGEYAYETVSNVAESVKEGAKEVVPKINDDNSSINGKIIRIIDPKTMLIYKEELERTMCMEMEMPGSGFVPTKLIEKRIYEFDYKG